jgi:oligoribonuclease NrnB/cAMP/cGMP phosphodiesterase (DHH superfamily)
MTLRTVLYHGNCTDGFCAAWAAWRCLGDTAEYIPVVHGEEPPWDKITGRVVYLLDFSYKQRMLELMIAGCQALVLLDHHKTAQAELAGVPGFAPHLIRFDMDKSGGRLAWEYFHPFTPAPWLVDYTEDRDLWRWKLDWSREISAFLASHPFGFHTWDVFARLTPGTPSWERFVNEGAAILRYQARQVDEQVKNATEIELDGHRVLCVNATHLTSEIAGKLAEGRPFGVCYFLRGDGTKVVSLRSREGGVDVSEIARKRGGGGHRNSAGYQE